MPVNAGWGEHLVGAYQQRVRGCEVVSYNNRSDEPGNQMEADVIAIDNEGELGEQNLYICEVVTHMDGDLYSGSPKDESGWWMEYSNTKSYHRSLEKLMKKFLEDYRYVDRNFGGTYNYNFEFWAPKVTGGKQRGALVRGLERLSDEFEDETGEELDIVINDKYAARFRKLRRMARNDTSDYGSPAFRFLQIVENLEYRR